MVKGLAGASAQVAKRARASPRFTPVFKDLVAVASSDLRLAEVDAATVSEVVAPALERHGVLVFRGQHGLTAHEHNAFLAGLPDVDLQELERPPFALGDPSCLPELPRARLLGIAAPGACPAGVEPEQTRVGREWHTDGCGFTALYSVTLPEAARRTTLFADGYRAWELLPPGLRRAALALNGSYGCGRLADLPVAELHRRGARMSADGLRLERGLEPGDPVSNRGRFVHLCGPPVKRHPFSGRHCLWTIPMFLEGFEGLGEAESRETLSRLLEPGVSPPEVYEHVWQPGDLVLWDNRRMLHSTSAEFLEEPHLLRQIYLRTATPMLPPEAEAAAMGAEEEEELPGRREEAGRSPCLA